MYSRTVEQVSVIKFADTNIFKSIENKLWSDRAEIGSKSVSFFNFEETVFFSDVFI
jgi:hypothetical protein